ncbi:hypothetical protein ACW2QC_01710 [Virgibacillus sp. FSP13]
MDMIRICLIGNDDFFIAIKNAVWGQTDMKVVGYLVHANGTADILKQIDPDIVLFHHE